MSVFRNFMWSAAFKIKAFLCFINLVSIVWDVGNRYVRLVNIKTFLPVFYCFADSKSLFGFTPARQIPEIIPQL
jgi:hypothetical protein